MRIERATVFDTSLSRFFMIIHLLFCENIYIRALLMIHDWWKNYLIISTDNPWMRVFKVKAALKKIRSQSETVAQIDRVWLKKNRSIPLSRNVFSKTRILRALLYQCKNDWHTNCFYKLNFHIIYYHSTWRREMFPFGRYCHINHSYFKTGTDNDVSIYFAATRSPLIYTKVFWNSFSIVWSEIRDLIVHQARYCSGN